MGVARAGKSAWMLSLRWKVNSGCASRLAYQSRRLGGLPVMYTCPSIWWNRISMRCGCPVFRPLVVMSITPPCARACCTCSSIRHLPLQCPAFTPHGCDHLSTVLPPWIIRHSPCRDMGHITAKSRDKHKPGIKPIVRAAYVPGTPCSSCVAISLLRCIPAWETREQAIDVLGKEDGKGHRFYFQKLL